MTGPEIVAALYDAIDRGDMAAARALLTDDFRHTSTRHPAPMDAETWLGALAPIHRAFPDTDHDLHDLASEGDRVTGAFRVSGTHTGVLDLPAAGLHDVAPTGRRFELPPERFTATLRDGRVAAIHVDMGGEGGLGAVLRQLGLAGEALSPRARG